jgi:lipopolysaccharide transport protein LptA
MTDDLTKHDSNAPVNVSGKVMKGLRTAGRLDLEGDVVITQADARLLSDKATVFSEPVTNRTKKAIARGNVKFSKQSTPQSPALKAEADEMEYLVAERQVFMTGKPKVWRGNELIQGKEIVLELDSGTVTVKEARGILEPNNMPKKK